MNIVKDYQWAVSTEKEARAQVPVIKLIEYQQTNSQIRQQLEYWAGIISQAVQGEEADAYKKLYLSKPTGNDYTFPFYSPYHHTITNSWGEAGGAIGQTVDNWIVPFAKLVKPTAGVEHPKSWQGTAPASYSFTFDLLNTIQPTTNIPLNKGLLKVLITANLHVKQQVIAQIPPVLYEISVPGVRYSPVSAITNLTVENVGQVNIIDDENVPDAYRVTIQITELISESRDIYNNQSRVFSSVE